MDEGVAALVTRYALPGQAGQKLLCLLELLVDAPLAPTTIKTHRRALDDHLADSLVALEEDAVRAAGAVLDLGSGAGLPGVPLAIALPDASITLLESAARKCQFLEAAVESCRVANAEVVHARAEGLEAGHGRYDVVTARAVAPLPVTLEYAAPLLRVGGTVLVWRGRRDPQAERAANVAASELGLGTASIRPVRPYPGAQHRHLYAVEKVRDTPPQFPRRPGIALKRPLGGRRGQARPSSDREQR